MEPSVLNVVNARQMREGGGFLVRRPLGDSSQKEHDPFLMLDHLGPVDYKPGEAIGAPDHPHRGFETVTYVIDGGNKHYDSAGNSGVLNPGMVQWMTAGRGVVHAEMPSDELLKNGGKSEGFQLWVNLPAKFKMVEPRYQDTPAESMPIVKLTDGTSTVKVIAGEFHGTRSPIETRLNIVFLDAQLAPGSSVKLPIPNGYNGFLYCWRGSGTCGEKKITKLSMGDAAYFSKTTADCEIEVKADSSSIMHALLIAGPPIGEPVAKHGPFVMNTREEIEQAITDYRSGKLGGKIAGSEERFRITEEAAAKQGIRR